MIFNADNALDEAIISIIQKDKVITDKSQLVADLSIINNNSIPNATKLASYERLIQYLSYLPKWEEELITYLGNRFTLVKSKL